MTFRIDSHELPQLIDKISIPFSVRNEDGKIKLCAILAGYSRENITIEFENDFLLIKCIENDGEFITPFIRKIKLPNNADVDSIEAKMLNGILRIEIKELIVKRKINVN